MTVNLVRTVQAVIVTAVETAIQMREVPPEPVSFIRCLSNHKVKATQLGQVFVPAPTRNTTFARLQTLQREQGTIRAVRQFYESDLLLEQECAHAVILVASLLKGAA